MRLLPLLIIVILGPASGCAVADNDAGIPLTRFDSGIVHFASNSGIREKRLVVVRDTGQWQETWSALHANRVPEPDLPSIDFGRVMAVVYALGEQRSGGYAVEITGARFVGDHLQVDVEIRQPSASCIVAASITAPADIVILPMSEKAVVAEETVAETAC